MLAERGIDVSYETIRRWVLKFGPAIADNVRSEPLYDLRSLSKSDAHGPNQTSEHISVVALQLPDCGHSCVTRNFRG
jgi:hypothetical protein